MKSWKLVQQITKYKHFGSFYFSNRNQEETGEGKGLCLSPWWDPANPTYDS